MVNSGCPNATVPSNWGDLCELVVILSNGKGQFGPTCQIGQTGTFKIGPKFP